MCDVHVHVCVRAREGRGGSVRLTQHHSHPVPTTPVSTCTTQHPAPTARGNTTRTQGHTVHGTVVTLATRRNLKDTEDPEGNRQQQHVLYPCASTWCIAAARISDRVARSSPAPVVLGVDKDRAATTINVQRRRPHRRVGRLAKRITGERRSSTMGSRSRDGDEATSPRGRRPGGGLNAVRS